jgi:hypothetical protein
MKSASSFVVPLAASFLLACGAGTETVADEPGTPQSGETSTEVASTPAPGQSGSQVSAMACVTLYRPRYITWWTSFPIEVDGQVGGCETHDDCTTTCWGQESAYQTHSGFFYCTYCP